MDAFSTILLALIVVAACLGVGLLQYQLVMGIYRLYLDTARTYREWMRLVRDQRAQRWAETHPIDVTVKELSLSLEKETDTADLPDVTFDSEGCYRYRHRRS
jgi:hypothetical protein